jgi:hypothetical protein
MYPSFKIQIVAENYRTFLSDSRDFDEGDWDAGEINLIKGGKPGGTIRLADGSAAAGAEITIAIQDHDFLSMNTPGKVWKSEQALRVVADANGHFEFKDPGAHRLVLITHDEGFLELRSKHCTLIRVLFFCLGGGSGVLKVGNKPTQTPA